MHVPKYRKNGDGRAFVEHQTRRTYLGIWGTPESKRAYRDFLTTIFAEPAELVVPDRVKVAEVLLHYLDWAESYYQSNGVPSQEFLNVRSALGDFVELFGEQEARTIGPRYLLQLQDALVEAGYARTTINGRVSRVKRALRWCASREIIPGSVAESIWTVDGLHKGRTKAREPSPVKPVPAEVVAATLPFLSPVVAGMVQVQYLCGMRPQDVCAMRLIDIDRSSSVWIYRPESHKNAWRGKELIKAIPPAAQQLIQPFLDRPDDAYLFSPRESITWWNQQRSRRTKQFPCEVRSVENRKKLTMKRRGGRPLSTRYSTCSYGKSIVVAVEKANKAGASLPMWHPNQLRHSIATKLRKLLGQQAAQAWLGHAKIDTTALYAEVHEDELKQISERLSASE